MDVDKVDFRHEPFDCAVLLSDGQFPDEWESVLLFEEWLIPVCAAADAEAGAWSLARLQAAEQLHPTPDRRDWRRWLQVTGLNEQVPLKTGQLFDMLELGIVAAARGYGAVSYTHLDVYKRQPGKSALITRAASTASSPLPSPASTPCRRKAPAPTAPTTSCAKRSRRCPVCKTRRFAEKTALRAVFSFRACLRSRELEPYKEKTGEDAEFTSCK